MITGNAIITDNEVFMYYCTVNCNPKSVLLEVLFQNIMVIENLENEDALTKGSGYIKLSGFPLVNCLLEMHYEEKVEGGVIINKT